MYNIFYVESPLQLLSAISANSKLTKESILIITLSAGDRCRNDEQILSLVDKNDWQKVHVHKHHQGKVAFNFFSLKKILNHYFQYKNKVDKFFFGDIRSFEMVVLGGLVDARETILLDDGSFTITAQQQYISKKKSPINFNGFITKLKLMLFKVLCGWGVSKIRTPNLYSFFDLKKHMADGQVNYYTHLQGKEVNIDNDYIFYFGSKLSEAGYVNLPLELSSLTQIYAKYGHKKLYYIPHRDETASKLQTIEGMGFVIKQLGIPAEVFFDTTDVMPSTVISSYSTTLYSCFIRFNNVKVIAIDIRTHIHDLNAKQNADNIYPYYRDIGIKVETF